MAAVAKEVKETKKTVKKEEEEEDVSDIEVSSDEGEEDEEKDPGLTDSEVVTKYKLASDIANRNLGCVCAHVAGVVKKVADACVAGATTVALSKMGDELIVQETGKLYTKKVNGKFIAKGSFMHIMPLIL